MSSRLLEQTRQYALLMRVHKPIGTMLLLWPALCALWLAGDGHPDPHVFTVIVLGVLLMRAAGCVINDFADRDIDPYVKRTRDRPLAAGRVSPAEALTLFAALSLIAVGLVLTLNHLTRLLAVGGALLTVIYPFLKRVISVPQFVLGIAFGWSVPMVYAAQTGSVPPEAWLLFIAVVLWATAYDTMYAMVDRADDLELGVKSTAILFADADRFVIAVMQLMLLLDLYFVGRLAGLGAWYLAGVAGAALAALYQQYLIRDREPERCFRAFLNNNLLGAAVFSGILLDYTFPP
jgi:4-hydroxybenzoate polyprenyltransferase